MSLSRKRNVNSHLVTVEVGVKRCTSKGMKLNCSTLNKNRLKCLNTESVKCGSTVKHYRVSLDNNFESIPNLGISTFNHLSCRLYVACNTCLNKTLHNEGLEQFKSHFLRKTALIHLELGSYDDNRTSRIVNTLTEKVLTETSLLTFKHIGKRFQRSVVRTCNRSASSAVVDKCVNSLLKHSLFISDDNVGSVQLKELFKTVVSVDNSSVKVVEVGGSKSAAVKLNHRTNIGGNYRNDVQNHPLGTVARLSECLCNLKALENSCLFLTACILKLCTKVV